MQLETILDRPDVPVDVKDTIKSYLVEQKQLKETQQELGLQIHQTLDSMGDAIHVVDTDMRFLLFNKAFKQWNKDLGLKEDVIGLRVDEVFPFLSDTTIDEYNQVFSNGKPLVKEEHTIIQEREFITETQKIPVFVEGTVTQIVTVVKDITEYKQAMIALQESEEKYRNLIERANDGISIVQDSLIKFVNPSLAKMTGYTFEEIESTPFMKYVHPDVISDVNNRYERRMAGKSVPSIYETKLVLKNGKMLEVEINAGIITYQGKPADLAIIRDISERKQVEQALRESEEKYRTILENIEDGYYEVDLIGNFTFFNDSTCRIHGYSSDELMGMNNREYTDEQTSEMVFKTFNSVYRTGEPTKIFAYEIKRKDGTKRVNEASVSLITDLTGKPTGFRGIIRDITERIAVERALRESEENYRTILENIEDGYYEVDLAGNFVFFNDSICNILGYPREEILGMNYKRYSDDKITPLVFETFNTVYRTGEPKKAFNWEAIRRDGTRRNVEASVSLISDSEGHPSGFRGIIRDVTERMEVEQALRESEARYRRLIDLSPDAITLTDLEFNITEVNQQAIKMRGAKNANELIGKNGIEVIVPEDRQQAIENAQRTLQEGMISNFEYRLLRQDGSVYPAELSAALITDEKDNPFAFISIVRDITDRKRTEEALKESEQQFRVISERTMMGVCILQDEVIKYANQALSDIFECTIEEMLNWKPNESAKVIHPEDRPFVTEQGRKKQLGEEDIVTNYSYRVVPRDGDIKWVDNYSKTIIYMGKTADLVTLVDITERKKAEEALRDSKEKYQMLVEKMQEGVLLEDPKGKISFVNPRTAELLGYSEEELLGKHWSYIVPEEYFDQVTIETGRRSEGIGSNYEASLLAKDGQQIPVIITSTPVSSTTGEFDGVLTVFTDITERKLGEKKLHESALKYRTILETIEEGYYEVDLTGNFTFYNDSICKFLGYTKDELLGMNFRQYMDEETAKMVFETYNTVFRTGEPSKLFNFEVIRKDKKKMFNEASVSLITNSDGEPTGFRGIVRDITERYEMERALDEERVKYQMLLEKLEEGVTLEDTEGIITFTNPKTLETLGYTEEELLGQHWSFIVPESEHDKSSVETAKRVKGISSIYESKMITKNGIIYPVIVTATPIFSNTGEFQGVLVLSTDITERKRVEEELKQSEEKYSNLFHYSNDAIILHDLDGKIIDVNQKTLDLFGYTKSEILQIKIPSLHPPEMIEASRNQFERIVEDGFVTFEISFMKKNGEVIPADVSSSLFTIGGQKVIQGIVRDITERKKAEQALQQVKLEEERYHAMMSHFINNDMQKIINNLELLSLMYDSKLELDTGLITKVIHVASGSSKTIDLVNKIFEVLQSPFIRSIHKVELVDIINEVVSELPAFSQLVNIDKKNLEASIFVDIHLKDVFTELLLFILSAYTRSTKTSIDIKGLHRNQYFCIIINDYCSEPLSQEIISKLSGKITDKWEIIGHNIGIALASVIMQYFGGSLEIYPSELKGNEFQLLFPLELIKNTSEIT